MLDPKHCLKLASIQRDLDLHQISLEGLDERRRKNLSPRKAELLAGEMSRKAVSRDFL